jgi:DNA polymerase
MDSLQELNREIQSCKRCDLFFSRKRAVCGTGESNPQIMIIGEAPGAREDETGIPFVGRSGRLLRDVMGIAGLDMDSIYISNAVRCRPKIGKSPRISEIRKCSNFLRTEINILHPQILIPMGNSPLKSLRSVMGIDFGPISEIEGSIFVIGNIFVAPQFHPAAILRNPKRYERFKDNFLKLRNFVYDVRKMDMAEIEKNYRIRHINGA